MSVRENARYTIETGGKLQYIKQFDVESDSNGYSVDLSGVQFEMVVGKTSYVKIFNTGSKDVYVAFDSDHSDIDTSDASTYSLKISSGTPFSEVSIKGVTSKISLKCESGETTDATIIAW